MAKILEKHELPEDFIILSKIAHSVSEQAYPQLWNCLLQESNRSYKKEMTGDYLISFLSTFLHDFNARFICGIVGIADKDDAGRDKEEIIKGLLDGICKTLNIGITYEDEPPLPAGIKRLTNIKQAIE